MVNLAAVQGVSRLTLHHLGQWATQPAFVPVPTPFERQAQFMREDYYWRFKPPKPTLEYVRVR